MNLKKKQNPLRTAKQPHVPWNQEMDLVTAVLLLLGTQALPRQGSAYFLGTVTKVMHGVLLSNVHALQALSCIYFFSCGEQVRQRLSPCYK